MWDQFLGDEENHSAHLRGLTLHAFRHGDRPYGELTQILQDDKAKCFLCHAEVGFDTTYDGRSFPSYNGQSFRSRWNELQAAAQAAQRPPRVRRSASRRRARAP